MSYTVVAVGELQSALGSLNDIHQLSLISPLGIRALRPILLSMQKGERASFIVKPECEPIFPVLTGAPLGVS